MSTPRPRTVGITMVKNEADVIASTIKHMSHHCDHMIVADNQSTDGTSDILAWLRDEQGVKLTIVEDNEPAYYQSAKMTRLAEQASDMGAEWIIPFDADELWVPLNNPAGRVGDVLEHLECDVATAYLYDYRPTALDTNDHDPMLSMVWRSEFPAQLPKVAFRWRDGSVIHQGNHGVTLPGESTSATVLRVNHYPYRSAAQFASKGIQGGKAYEATDLPDDMGKHWRDYKRLADAYGDGALEGVFRDHFWFSDPASAGLVRDPALYRGNW